MSFSIGTSGSGMGPRSALHSFGNQAENRAFEWRIVVRLLQYLKPYWQRLLAALVLTLIASALTLTTPYLVKVALDQYIVQGETSGLTTIALLTAATFVGIYIVSAIQSYMLSWVGDRLLATLRSQMFGHLQALSLGYHDTHIVGVTISRVISDVSVINDLLSQGLVSLVGDTLVLAGI